MGERSDTLRALELGRYEKPGTRPGLSYLVAPARFELASSSMAKRLLHCAKRIVTFPHKSQR